jgi:carbamoyl-phosphate synthase small subunit
MEKAFLVLEDGTVFEGRSCGVAGEVTGEVVFQTDVVGYQEVLTTGSTLKTESPTGSIPGD